MAEHITPIGGFSQAGAEKLREMAENGAVFAAYLKFHGRMFKHSPSVTLEFYVQRPESRYVASQMQWEKAGKPIVPDSDGIRFRDSKGNIVELYDFSQCVNQKNEPYQWRMTEEAGLLSVSVRYVSGECIAFSDTLECAVYACSQSACDSAA